MLPVFFGRRSGISKSKGFDTDRVVEVELGGDEIVGSGGCEMAL